jgi:hypothetical protein
VSPVSASYLFSGEHRAERIVLAEVVAANFGSCAVSQGCDEDLFRIREQQLGDIDRITSRQRWLTSCSAASCLETVGRPEALKG